MPKRPNDDSLIRHYKQKIKKLESKKREEPRSRRRVIIYSDSESDVETNKEINTINNNVIPDTEIIETSFIATQAEITPEINLEQSNEAPQQVATDSVTELDPEILLALGDPVDNVPVFGPSIHSDIANRWLPVLSKGLKKDIKEKLLNEHNIPENCKLLKAPSLNLEIAAAVADVVRGRDKKIENRQEQLGHGITAISKAMSYLINDGNKLDVIKNLSEGCRVLCDLHFVETQVRTKLITPCLDKSILNIIQEEERDETLFGNNLAEKIKAAKSIEKQGLQLKRNVPSSSKVTLQTFGPRASGNWVNPPRYPSAGNRGGRGGMYSTNRPGPSNTFRRSTQSAPAAASLPSMSAQAQSRQASYRTRAPTRH